jgi:magnesium chelatase family protein
MLTRTYSAILQGLDPIKIEVEVDTSIGLPNLVIIGLPSKAVEEAKERITTALLNCGYRLLNKRTIVNLAPADIRKSSPSLDFAIAVALLQQTQNIGEIPDQTIFLGELSLDGHLKPLRGALPLIIGAKKLGFKRVLFPESNKNEVSILGGIELHPIKHIDQFIQLTKKNMSLPKILSTHIKPSKSTKSQLSFDDILGQHQAKRVLEIAAAGGHNVLLTGPPGSGKSMLAKSLVSILPPLTTREALEVTSIYSVAGLTNKIISDRPFRSPHHSISRAGLIGGGSRLKPGEISLAHRGVLFLDEFAEFPVHALESLRQPLESGSISLARAIGTTIFPAQFSLVGATNPCPCGYFQSQHQLCNCSELTRQRYLKKLSGPILDRIDLHLWVNSEQPDIFRKNNKTTTSAEIQEKVSNARHIQQTRLKDLKLNCNADLDSRHVRQVCDLSLKSKQLLLTAANQFKLSTRGIVKAIKVAQTISDLDDTTSNQVLENHLTEALSYRNTINSFENN